MYFFTIAATQKLNGSAVPLNVRNRPRIPTPDREQIATTLSNNNSVGVALMAHHSLQSEVPVLGALVLSPIQELDGGSVNNTLSPGSPGTAALAQAVLSPGLGPILTAPATPMTFTPVAVSQIVSGSLTSTAHIASNTSPSSSLHPMTVTPVTVQPVTSVTQPSITSLVRLSPSLITSRIPASTTLGVTAPITTVSSLLAVKDNITTKDISDESEERTPPLSPIITEITNLTSSMTTDSPAMSNVPTIVTTSCAAQEIEKDTKPSRKQSSSKLGEVYV